VSRVAARTPSLYGVPGRQLYRDALPEGTEYALTTHNPAPGLKPSSGLEPETSLYGMKISVGRAEP
jgi:hypothetical protein